MRAYKGARQVAGKQAPRGMLRDIHEPFPSSFKGHCRGCGMPYFRGQMIVATGKGHGAYHPRCHKASRMGLFAQQAARKAQEAKGT